MRQRGNTMLWTTLHPRKWPFKNAWNRGLPYFHLNQRLHEARPRLRSVALGTRVSSPEQLCFVFLSCLAYSRGRGGGGRYQCVSSCSWRQCRKLWILSLCVWTHNKMCHLSILLFVLTLLSLLWGGGGGVEGRLFHCLAPSCIIMHVFLCVHCFFHSPNVKSVTNILLTQWVISTLCLGIGFTLKKTLGLSQ